MPAAKKTVVATKTTNKLTQAAKPVTSWSFSRYGDYKTCPLKFKLKHIDKIAEPKSDAMQKGIDAHNDAEAYVKGTLAKLPPVLSGLKDEFVAMRKMYKSKKFPMIVEDNWAFTAEWEETQWNDWVRCWVRIKLDAAHYVTADEMMVTDWKTGKPSEFKNAEYMEQLELYAVAALLMSARENVRVRVRLGFTEAGEIVVPRDKNGDEITYTRADLPRLMKEWNKRVKPMMSATNFPPRANSTCRWCFYGQAGKAKGGPGLCQF
jgi:Protein of unknown function (DUF2800).